MSHFEVTYRLVLQQGESLEEKITGICLEQSVELPGSVISDQLKRDVVGQPTDPEKIGEKAYQLTIRWPHANLGGESSQLLNILYGNISMKPGIRITQVHWKTLPDDLLKGPAVGIKALRDRYDIESRAWSCTALKPMGATTDQLAETCYEFASGGIDIIKDDHGLTNQTTAPFTERVKACVDALDRAAQETGRRSHYYPNITGPGAVSLDRYKQAAELGADGVLFCPHIGGLSTMHQLAHSSINLPIIAHPAFSGSLVAHPEQGFDPGVLYGALWRAFGADYVIYPNAGGRFTFTEADCEQVNNRARDAELPFRRSFPMPAGGIKRENVGNWLERYGNDTVFLIGGSLYEDPQGLRYAAQEFTEQLKD